MNEHIDTSDEADELELWTAFEELFIRAKEEVLGLEHPEALSKRSTEPLYPALLVSL